jgi:ribosomal protein S18 acetylase RimI-like enzyme
MAGTLQIRTGTTRDTRTIAEMSRCLIEVGLRGWSWHPTRVARALRLRETCVIVAECDGQFAGFAIAEFGDTRMHLALLAVQPGFQRRGIATALLRWLIASARTAGIREIAVELRVNNFAARAFYAALGFHQTRYIAGYYQNVESAIQMRLALVQGVTPLPVP